MNKEITSKERRELNAIASARAADPSLLADAEEACRQIAPLWPLKDFVAVNPMLGQTKEPFESAARRLSKTTGARLLRRRADYAEEYRNGAFSERHIEEAINRYGGARVETPSGVINALTASDGQMSAPRKTVSDVARAVTGRDWSSFIIDRFSWWAGGYFDTGQSAWKNPWRDAAPYQAWRAQAAIDRTPEIMGLKGFRKAIADLSPEPTAALAAIVDALAVPPAQRGAYFHRLLSTVSGWAGYRRQQGWRDELRGEGPRGVIDLLAIRAAYDYGVYRCLNSPALQRAWCEANIEKSSPMSVDIRPALVAQTALELAYQEDLIGMLASASRSTPAGRPAAQAVFCIDVRSERIRRALESVNADIGTFGFAGFFGFPIAIVQRDSSEGQAQCPVLLEPRYEVCEVKPGGARANTFGGAWKRFKTGAISSFAFVESLGALFAGAMVRDLLRRPAPEIAPLGHLDASNPGCAGGTSMSLEDKVALAKGALSGISFNGVYARLIALVGHGASTTNNPFAAGLDCGACGGHSGEANAKIAASVLNEPEVRARLAALSAPIPEDTHFVAALHDTTTDEVCIYDPARIPSSHREDLRKLQSDFAEASRRARRDRASSLGLEPGADVDNRIKGRSRDWSEVRPEWGLAGCAAFIAAPRVRTHGLDLQGRTFLHSYDWRMDADSAILELIMAAPLVVASWISLQYYGSSVDNQAYGSGDKTLHNVIGGLGVLEGAGGDLRGGLPMQSVHDGRTLAHKPLRLTAFIEAPTERIDSILAKHENVRALFDNEWLHLIAITNDGAAFERYAGNGRWMPALLPRAVRAGAA